MSATMNGMLCAISPKMKCTMRGGLSSLIASDLARLTLPARHGELQSAVKRFQDLAERLRCAKLIVTRGEV
jgi:hypothetical protein